MSRFKVVVLLFLLGYTTVLFFSASRIYNDGSPDVMFTRRPGGSLQALEDIEPIMPPNGEVQGAVNTLDMDCDQVAVNASQYTYFHQLDHDNYILSAYYDERKHPKTYIRLITLHSRSFSGTVHCLLNGTDGQQHSVKAIKYPFNENHARVFGGYIMSCPVEGIQDSHPCTVRVSRQPDGSGGVVTLPLRRIPAHREYVSSFGVCVPPLHGHITQSTLVDFIETTLQLGADHVYFYRYDGDARHTFTSAAILQVMQYYSHRGVVTVYPWKLPIVNKHIWYNGQMLAVHHCLYQAMWNHKYIAFNDIDEFIVPMRYPDWNSMMQALDDNLHCGFKISSAFFPLFNTEQPTALYNTVRTSFNRVRSKCIVRPERIFEMGIHHMSKWNEEEWTPKEVDPEAVLLHHYRRCDPYFSQKGFNCAQTISDETMLRYTDTLHSKFQTALQQLHNVTLTYKHHKQR